MTHPSTTVDVSCAYSAGQQFPSGALAAWVSPSTGQVLTQISETPEAVIAQVVALAQSAYQTHRRATAAQRSLWLAQAGDASISSWPMWASHAAWLLARFSAPSTSSAPAPGKF